MITPFRKIILSFTIATMTLWFLVTDSAIVKAAGYNNEDSTARINYASPVDVPIKPGLESSKSNTVLVISPEEEAMIRLLNQDRAKAGLSELEIDLTLVKLAREKSKDMVVHNYFGHISKELGTIYEQLVRENRTWTVVAENLVGAPNIDKAQIYIMHSPAHRNNVLNPNFQRVGVGIVRGGPYGKMITQIFLAE